MEERKNQEGVTLIELLAVVVILAIIAAVAVPVVVGQINNSKIKTDISNEGIIIDAIQRGEFDYGSQFSGQMSLDLLGKTTVQASIPTAILDLTSTAATTTMSNQSNSNPYEATVVGSDSTAAMPSTGSQYSLYNLLANGLAQKSQGSYLNSIPTPQTGTGSSWTIIETATGTSPYTNNPVAYMPQSVQTNKDYTSFTLPDSSGSGNDTFYIYPTSAS